MRLYWSASGKPLVVHSEQERNENPQAVTWVEHVGVVQRCVGGGRDVNIYAWVEKEGVASRKDMWVGKRVWALGAMGCGWERGCGHWEPWDVGGKEGVGTGSHGMWVDQWAWLME